MTIKNKITFTNASYLLKDNPPSHSYGISIFDIDGDDEPEIIVANSNSENIIYKYSETDQNFINIAPDNFKLKGHNTLSMCVGDFQGQGVPSIYMLHSDTFGGLKNVYDNLFIRTSSNISSLAFSDLFIKQPQMSNPYSGRSVAAMDYDGSGKHGFYIVNYDAPSLFYNFNQTTEKVQEISKELGIRQFSGGRSILTQYILNDKALDIFIGNENGSNSFFTKSTTTCTEEKFTNRARELDFYDELFNARGIAIADFNGNGLADIILGNWLGMNSIFMQNEKGVFKNAPPAFFREPMPVRNIIVADFDNDGNEEIFVNNFNEANKMFRYIGQNEWEEINIGSLACEKYFCTGASAGDLTGNGFLDLFISTGEAEKEKNRLFLGTVNNNFWIRIQPITQNGFPALSAKVRLISKNTKNQTKFICSGSGYLCQMEPVAHFGLGPIIPDIESIEITWPGNGGDTPISRVIHGKDIVLNSFIKIPHPYTKSNT